MKFSIPTTWDDRMADLVRTRPVYTVYGALDRDPVGGGNPVTRLPRASRERLAGHVATVRAAGVPFSYLLNGPCFGNREYTRDGIRAIVEFLGLLTDIGVECVTVSVPQVMQLVRQHAPSLRVRVSAIAFVDSVHKARFYDELGVSEITLDFNINREFDRLRAIRRAVRCDLALIVNDFCLLRCPWAYYHYNTLGHAPHSDGRGLPLDTCSLSCKLRLLERPVEMLRVPFIRPEDLERYESLGIHHFKIAGRGKETVFVERVLDAYTGRCHDGNLLDLFEGVKQTTNDELVDAFGALTLAMEGVWIDNRTLDGFLDRFEEIPCLDCDECKYCDAWAKKVVRTEPDRTARAAAAVEKVLDRWKRGSQRPG